MGESSNAPGERRLPVYLLLDTSGSMDGAPIQSVREGLEQFQREVAKDPFARDVVKVGVITFGEEARFVTSGLIPIQEFQVPELVPSNRDVARLDLAFRLLRESFDRDVVRPRLGGPKGDWRPVVFVFTDGRPTDGYGKPSDQWKAERDALINRPKRQVKPANFVAVGCGPNVDDETLKAISTGTAFCMGTSEAAFVSLFSWRPMPPITPGDVPPDIDIYIP